MKTQLAVDANYWLSRCQGFVVGSPDERLGVVEELRYLSRCDRPDVLAVRAGRLGRRLLLVPVDDVAEIHPGTKRIVLRGGTEGG